ncbi:MAG: FAD-dependent oxidoreductase, partial [Chloroflexi bacterium]|nr:FAD-dependent oxidoreductase [Chloroflexota bacterium]
RKTFLKDTDPQLAKRFRPLLARQGVSVNIGLEFRDIVQTDDGTLQVRYEQRGKEGHVEGDVVLLSTGRWPYTEGVGVEELGIAMSKRDILVNETLETSVPGIYAIGDCIGGAMLAHVASYEGEVAVENIMGHRRKVDYTVVPACIFTMPEIADVGLTEEQAKEQSIAHTVSMFPFTASGKALAQGETEGQVRLVCEEGTGKVLGMHIMGPHASDLIAEGAMAMRLGATARDIAELIHAHPTLPEAVMEAGKEQLDGAIHYQRRRR